MRKGDYIKRKDIRNFVLVLLVLIGLNVLCAPLHIRWDLTREKRFTLSAPTKRLLRSLDGPVRITVFLKGKFPAAFRHLALTTEEMLDEFRRYAGKDIDFAFVNPLAGLPDSIQARVRDSLGAMGIMPYNVRAQQDLSEGLSVQLLFPGGVVEYHGRRLPINLLQPQAGLDPQATLEHSAALLEYKFASAIARLAQKEPPTVAYMLGHGEPLTPAVYDALTVLQQNYRLDTLNLRRAPAIPLRYKALVFLDPQEAFTEDDKLKIDQYVMHGGRVLWAIDPVRASSDSLQVRGGFIAFDRGLNLDDLLFTYGVRINPDLLQDLQCFSIPVTVGHIGNRPQIERLPWPYQPLFLPSADHPVVKNMDMVLGQFPSSMDTIKAPGIGKTILLASSLHSRALPTPARVSLESVKVKPDPRQFVGGALPVAIALQGHFPSAFQHRLDAERQATLKARFGYAFQGKSGATRMIVVSNARLFTNAVSEQDGPLPMGMDPYTRQIFANREFFENSLTWLTDTTDIMQARNKDFALRLLDQEKVKAQQTTWQLLNFLIPLGFILLFAVVFQYVRQRKYS